MKIIYKAFDGVPFDTEEECKKYENSHTYGSLEMLNKLGSPVSCLDDAYFVVIHSDLDKERVENLLDVYGYKYNDIETIPTVIAWDNESEKWKDIHIKIENLNEELTRLKEMLSMTLKESLCQLGLGPKKQ